MSEAQSAAGRFLHPHTLFRVFKYIIYCLLALNIVLFFQEEFLASQEVFGGRLDWSRLTEAFSATIDTAAWVVLLLLFELETAVIADEKLQGGLKWLLTGIRAIAYSFILWAFYGYVTKYGVMSNLSAFEPADVCSLVGNGFSWVQDLDQYPSLDAAACLALQGQELMRIAGTQIIGTVDAVHAARNLTVVDIVNAADWLVVVVMLELEVYLQLKNLLSRRLIISAKMTKGVLYFILFVCAIYWGFLGDFLDFWDAFLWLLAFIFIEMNIFQWHGELQEQREPQNNSTETHTAHVGGPHGV